MTTLKGILSAAGCELARDNAGRAGSCWVRMTSAARAILVAAGVRDALDCADGVWLEVVS